VARTFARYCAAFDPRTEIPPSGLLASGRRRPAPYIYSPAEIQALLKAARALRPVDGLRPHTYAVLLGLLASTGIRIGEALRLTVDDVRWDASALSIRNSKRISERLVPLHSSTLDELRKYAQRRPIYLTDPAMPIFLVSGLGRPLGHSGVLRVFHRLRDQAGIQKSGGRQPRIHDLRHTFACIRMLQWHREGVPLDQAILSLSAYLGHVQPTDTYWYLSSIPDLLDACGERFEQYTERHWRGDLT
jgi:integrase